MPLRRIAADAELLRQAKEALERVVATRAALEESCPVCDLGESGQDCYCVERLQAVLDARLALPATIAAIEERLLQE